VRTTLTLDEDVASRLRAEARRTGKPFKAVVNEGLRLAFANRRLVRKTDRFLVRPRDMGELRPGLSLDNIGDLLEVVEGPLHR
jgi:hypothetical protein